MQRDRRVLSQVTTVLLLGASAIAVTGAMAGGGLPPTPRPAPACTLTPTQHVKSVKAFAEMMPVFRHPRCTNCHGGVNPFVEEEVGRHRGGAMTPPPPFNHEQCQDCHDQLAGWDIPGTPLFFAGKSDQAICEQVKAFAETGHNFVEHIRNDHGGIQFIAAGFAGDRALDAQSRADYDVKVEPPPGTQPELTELARKWVEAMGGEFVGPLDCGCKVPEFRVHFESTITTIYGGGAGGSTAITGKGDVVLKLVANGSDPDYDVTSGPDQTNGLISWSGVSLTPGAATGCQAAILSSPPTKFGFLLSVGAGEQQTLALEVVPEPDKHSVRKKCRSPAGQLVVAPVETMAGTFSGGWIALHGEGEGTAALAPPQMPSAGDMEKMKNMAEAMQKAHDESPSEQVDMAQMQEMMKMMVPDADARLAAARKNFVLSMPGVCTAGASGLATCTVKQTRKTSAAEFTENTVITIGLAPSTAGK